MLNIITEIKDWIGILVSRNKLVKTKYLGGCNAQKYHWSGKPRDVWMDSKYIYVRQTGSIGPTCYIFVILRI